MNKKKNPSELQYTVFWWNGIQYDILKKCFLTVCWLSFALTIYIFWFNFQFAIYLVGFTEFLCKVIPWTNYTLVSKTVGGTWSRQFLELSHFIQPKTDLPFTYNSSEAPGVGTCRLKLIKARKFFLSWPKTQASIITVSLKTLGKSFWIRRVFCVVH